MRWLLSTTLILYHTLKTLTVIQIESVCRRLMKLISADCIFLERRENIMGIEENAGTHVSLIRLSSWGGWGILDKSGFCG